MFAKTIIDSDAFLDMPLSTQALYFHLSMRADDDGFLNNAKKILRTIGAAPNDYDLLVAKRFIIQFEDGICVIKHWRIHNYIQKDRYKPTIYQEEKACLIEKENKSYTLDTGCIHDVSSLEAQVRLGKDRLEIDKDSIEESLQPAVADQQQSTKTVKETKHKYGEYSHVLLKDSELNKLNKDFGEQATLDAIKYLDEYIEMKGSKYKSHYLAMRKWVFDAVKQHKKEPVRQSKNKFNNFPQREYDYDNLEKQLLANNRLGGK